MALSCCTDGMTNNQVRGLDGRMSMTVFFEYLHDHPATTELTKLLAPVVMFHTCGRNIGRTQEFGSRVAS
jgi:hypothetical protein